MEYFRTLEDYLRFILGLCNDKNLIKRKIQLLIFRGGGGGGGGGGGWGGGGGVKTGFMYCVPQ